jgi:hypothetical protein
MSTSAVTFSSAPILPGRRYDRVFFPIMAGLILATVFLGFAKTYYLAGLIHAPLPSWIVHVHGALFSSWIILLSVQIGLVSARRVDLHKKLGLFGFGLACLMILFGLLAARNSLTRGFSPIPGVDARTFFVVPVTDIFIFATLIYFSYKLRTDSAAHKRLIMISTVALLDAAVARWPFAFIRTGPHVLADLCVYSFLFLLAGYDLWSTHKVHRATIWASLFLIVVEQIRIPLAMSPPWLRFADIIAGKL